MDLIDLRKFMYTIDYAVTYRWLLHIRDHHSRFSCLAAPERKEARLVMEAVNKIYSKAPGSRGMENQDSTSINTAGCSDGISIRTVPLSRDRDRCNYIIDSRSRSRYRATVGLF